MLALATRGIVIIGGFFLIGCSLSDLVGEPGQPETEIGPGTVNTVAGALQLYRGVRDLETEAVSRYISVTAVLSDEMRPKINSYVEQTVSPNVAFFDQRNMREGAGFTFAEDVYGRLHGTRIAAQHARQVLATFSIVSTALQGRMYLAEGLMHVYLAELFCSGIPLSRFDPVGGATLAHGSPRDEVLTRAVTLFDSAALLSADSTRFVYLAAVLKARVLLQLNRYEDAALAVQSVPDTFALKIFYAGRALAERNGFQRVITDGAYVSTTVSDEEGENGMAFISSRDRRSDTVSGVIQLTGSAPYRHSVARKYSDLTGEAPIVIASGTEARLIEAEAALRSGDVATMIRILNRLRTSCSGEGPCAVPAPAGTGGISGLPPLEDPAVPEPPLGKTAAAARADLLFSERAFWLFLTGHRQGDLRRLIRQYGRTEDTVYPTGTYPFVTPFGQAYGHDVTVPVPDSERTLNPLYQGCIDREA